MYFLLQNLGPLIAFHIYASSFGSHRLLKPRVWASISRTTRTEHCYLICFLRHENSCVLKSKNYLQNYQTNTLRKSFANKFGIETYWIEQRLVQGNTNKYNRGLDFKNTRAHARTKNTHIKNNKAAEQTTFFQVKQLAHGSNLVGLPVDWYMYILPLYVFLFRRLFDYIFFKDAETMLKCNGRLIRATGIKHVLDNKSDDVTVCCNPSVCIAVCLLCSQQGSDLIQQIFVQISHETLPMPSILLEICSND